MIGLDALLREREGFQRLLRAFGLGGIDLGIRDAQGLGLEGEPVEAKREVDQGLVAPHHHLLDDGAHRLVHVLRHLALGREESGESLREGSLPRVEPLRHYGRPAA